MSDGCINESMVYQWKFFFFSFRNNYGGKSIEPVQELLETKLQQIKENLPEHGMPYHKTIFGTGAYYNCLFIISCYVKTILVGF